MRNRLHWLLAAAVVWCAGVVGAATLEQLTLTGNAAADRCEVRIEWRIRVDAAGCYDLVAGRMAPLAPVECSGVKESFWHSAPEGRIVRSGEVIRLEADGPGLFEVTLNAALAVIEEGASRRVALEFPPAIQAAFALHFAPNQVDFRVPGALNVAASADALDGIWSGGSWQLDWKVAVDDRAGLVVGYDSATAVAVDAGTVRSTTDFRFTVTQGELKELRFAVPSGSLVSAVESSCLLERWYFDREKKLLSVWPVRNFPADFQLSVRLERALGGLPEKISFSPLLPENARQNNSEWLIGAGPGIKLSPIRLDNLIQTSGTPALATMATSCYGGLRQMTSFHAAGNFDAVFEAAAIMPVYTSESETTIEIKDGVLAVRYDGKLSVRDAPLKEITIEYDGALEFNRLQGDLLRPQDYELEAASDGRKAIRLQFTREVTDATTFALYFEMDLRKKPQWALSGFDMRGARGGRGSLLVTAEPGLQLAGVEATGIIPVHPDTLTVRVAGLLQAYLYRESNWKLSGTVEMAPRHITGEVFSLVSAGESGAYGLTLFPFHLGGAPTDRLVFRLSDRYENVEFSGAALARTRKTDDKPDDGFYQLEVYFRGRQSGDLVLLASYEISSGDDGKLPAGAIGCVGAEPEARYIAVSGLKSMKSVVVTANDAREIDPDELPAEYRNMINNSLLQAFRSADDLGVEVKLSAFAKDPLPPLLVANADYRTRIAASGQAVTEARYQVKNATAQFLQLRLPAQAQLWKVEVDGKQERASTADGVLMIPLARPLNINQPLQVGITYAQTFDPPADGQKIGFVLPEVLAPIQERVCQFELPGNFTVSDKSKAAVAPVSGVGALADLPALRLAVHFLPLWVLGLGIGVAMLLVVRGVTRGRKWMIAVGSILSLGTLAIWGIAALRLIQSVRLSAFKGPMPGNTVLVTDAADFGAANPVIELAIRRIGTAPAMAWGSLAAAIILLALAILVYRRWRQRWMAVWGGAFAAALTAVWAAQSREAMVVLVLIAAIGGALVLPLAFNVAAYRYWKRLAAVVLLCGIGWFGLGAVEIDDYTMNLGLSGENASIHADFDFEMKAGDTWNFAPGSILLTQWQAPKDCTVRKNDQGDWILETTRDRKGVLSYDGLSALVDDGAGRGIALWLPESFLGNVVAAHDDTFGWESADAITREKTDTADLFRFDGTAGVRFFRLVRRNAGEQAVELQAAFQSDLTFRRDAVFADIRMTVAIPQGRQNELEIAVPEGLAVTQVDAPELNTWRFDAESRRLKLYFNQWLPRECKVQLKAARHWNNLPQKWTYQVPRLVGARLEHGAVVLFTSPDVRVTVPQAKGATPMDKAIEMEGMTSAAAFHYGETAEFELNVEDVKPELRIEEQTAVRYEDERVTISSLILLEVLKGGIFSADIGLPAGFEVSSVAGIANDDWEEIRRPGENGVLRLHFRERLTGAVRIELGLTRLTEHGYNTETVPRLSVAGATKLAGLLTVAAERGTTLTVTGREGAVVAENNPESSNSLIFKLLNPEWKIGVRFEATPPWIQVTAMQNVRMRLNNVDTELEAGFKIENNGVKSLTVQLPPNWTLPEFDGRFIGKMTPLGDNRWQLDMTRKIEREYRLRIRGRLAADADGVVRVAAATFPDASAQSGCLAVYTSDSLELKPPVLTGDISEQNTRNLPPDLNRLLPGGTPVAAFRTIGTHWDANLTTISNQNAGVIKATASELALTTLLADTGVLQTRGTMTVENSGDAFLSIALPADAEFWGAKVNGVPVEAVRSPEGRVLLPLESGSQQVEFVYVMRGERPGNGLAGKLIGPQMEIPLKNIRWQLFYPSAYRLRRTGGSLEERSELAQMWSDDYGGGKGMGQLDKVKLMNDSRNLTLSGDIQGSNKMMQQALDMTADVSQRNDLAGEMLLNNRQYNLSNISKRQSSLARNRAQSESGDIPMEGKNNINAAAPPLPQGGQPQQDANPYLQEVADKIFTQQQAVYAAPQIFDLGWHPDRTSAVFERAMEIHRDAPLEVMFTLEGDKVEHNWRGIIVLAGIVLGMAFVLWCLVPKRRQA